MIKLYRTGGLYTLYTEQKLNISLEEAWNFFSNPRNLAEITPSHMGFVITSRETGEKTYQGQIISYKINLLPGIPSRWVTEISAMEEKRLFVDEQRFGPYRFWHHKHIFADKGDYILMTDIVHYKIPAWIVGRLIHGLFIGRKLRQIFQYRYDYLDQRFNRLAE